MAKLRTTHGPAAAPVTDDALAFRAAVRGVKPLQQAPLPEGLAPAMRAKRRARPLHESLEASMPLVANLPLIESGEGPAVGAGDALSFQRPGVRPQVVRRLRRGLFPIESELDLHGSSQSQARDQLAQFLAACSYAGLRCVRIIHGKGYRSGARGPILKIAVDLWLRRHGEVLAFTSARPIDGGTGAVYVLLRVKH